jgi:hypothetical protein
MRGAALIILLFALGGASASEVADNCADCHDAAPVPDGHPPLTEVGTEVCGMCHGGGENDPYLAAVHGRHLELGVGCDYCHGEQVPPAAPPAAPDQDR